MIRQIQTRKYTWSEIDALCCLLAEKIGLSGFNPDIVIGISRGGVFPALIISQAFKTRELFTINISSTSDDSIRSERTSINIRALDGLPSLYTKKVLIVDDVINTGETLEVARNAIRDLNPGQVRTACPVIDTVNCSLNKPKVDYFVDQINAWAVFPWEPHH